MDLYSLFYVMDNMCNDVVVQNDALLDTDNYIIARGDFSDVKEKIEDLDMTYCEVTDLYTETDGTLYICIYEEGE